MDTQEIVTEVQIKAWKCMIQEQQQSGKTVRQWCAERDLPTTTFYDRWRKVKKSPYGDIGPAQQEFAEVPLTAMLSDSSASVRIITTRGTMELSQCTNETVKQLLLVMIHAE